MLRLAESERMKSGSSLATMECTWAKKWTNKFRRLPRFVSQISITAKVDENHPERHIHTRMRWKASKRRTRSLLVCRRCNVSEINATSATKFGCSHGRKRKKRDTKAIDLINWIYWTTCDIENTVFQKIWKKAPNRKKSMKNFMKTLTKVSWKINVCGPSLFVVVIRSWSLTHNETASV